MNGIVLTALGFTRDPAGSVENDRRLDLTTLAGVQLDLEDDLVASELT